MVRFKAKTARSDEAALLAMVMSVYDRCRKALEAGIAAERLEAFDFATLIRVRDTSGPDDTQAPRAALQDVLTRLEQLS